MTPDKVLCLRTCNPDMTSQAGFLWPREGGTVEADDWHPRRQCGNGLHGLLWGEGEGYLLHSRPYAMWLVFEAEAEAVVSLGNQVKVPRATVVKVGSQQEVTAWLAERAPGRAVVGAHIEARGNATIRVGDRGTAVVGDRGTAVAGDQGIAISGAEGTSTAGSHGTAITGRNGNSVAAARATAIAGEGGTATAGYRGAVSAGRGGTLAIQHYNGNGEYVTVTGRVGSRSGRRLLPLLPGVKYRLNDQGSFRALSRRSVLAQLLGL